MAILVRPVFESAHWYSNNGEPVHTRPTSEGGKRATTLADARKLGLFPSVTSVFNVLAKHGLEKWKIKQVLLAMTRLPKRPDEPQEPYYDKVINEAFNQVEVAADAGSGVHGAIMCALQGRAYDKTYEPYVDRMFAFFEKYQIEPKTTEQVLVNHEDGFAGTMDFAGIRGGCIPMVLDWKTRRTKPGRAITSYESQPMQIAAYGRTYWRSEWPMVVGGNVYISSTEPGRIEMIPYDYDRMRREYECFQHCCEVWRHLNGYDPRLAGSAAEPTGPDTLEEKKHGNVVISMADGTLPSIIIPKPEEGTPAPARPQTPRATSKGQEKATEAQDAPKEKPTPKPTPPPKPVKATPETKKPAAPKAKAEPTPVSHRSKPALPVMEFGKFKGTEIHNIETVELEKIQKFCGSTLKNHPVTAQHIKRVLDARGQKAAKSFKSQPKRG